MIWFTGDTHFGHQNIIKYCNRPFNDIQEMDKILVSNWNSVVSKKDIVYHIGDLVWSRNTFEINELLNRLNFSELNLIYGNHDSKNTLKRIYVHGFNLLGMYHEVKCAGNLIVLMHYAMKVWNKSHHGSFMLYGHSHGTLLDDPNSLSYDVGVDNNLYYPVSIDRIFEIMSKKTFVPINHHERNPTHEK